MREQSVNWTIEDMAKTLGVSRSGYYRFCQRSPGRWQLENEELLREIQEVFQHSRETYGSPRVHAELKARGHVCSRPRVARLMRKAGIAAKMRRLFRTTTTLNSQRPVAPNRLEQDFTAAAPNQKWVADVTYIRTLEGWLYVAVVLDLFSRKVVGLAMDKSLHTELVLKALGQALQRRQPTEGLQHHSDRGCQYTSAAFQALLAKNKVVCSMSGTGNCYDNAVAESFFHTLKTESVYFERYDNREQAIRSIFEYVEVFYNNQRRHSTVGYLSPAEFERRYYQQALCS
jgi:putative transposase